MEELEEELKDLKGIATPQEEQYQLDQQLAQLPGTLTCSGLQVPGSQDPRSLVTPGSQGLRGSLTAKNSDTPRISGSQEPTIKGSQRKLDSEES